MLNQNELLFFNSIVTKVTETLQVNIPIIAYDHDLLNGKHKEALGCAWFKDDKVYQITIDEFFISECYSDKLYNEGVKGHCPKISEDLDYVLCHEVAHTVYMRHGKKHEELTQYLLDKVRND